MHLAWCRFERRVPMKAREEPQCGVRRAPAPASASSQMPTASSMHCRLLRCELPSGLAPSQWRKRSPSTGRRGAGASVQQGINHPILHQSRESLCNRGFNTQKRHRFKRQNHPSCDCRGRDQGSKRFGFATLMLNLNVKKWSQEAQKMGSTVGSWMVLKQGKSET